MDSKLNDLQLDFVSFIENNIPKGNDYVYCFVLNKENKNGSVEHFTSRQGTPEQVGRAIYHSMIQNGNEEAMANAVLNWLITDSKKDFVEIFIDTIKNDRPDFK